MTNLPSSIFKESKSCPVPVQRKSRRGIYTEKGKGKMRMRITRTECNFVIDQSKKEKVKRREYRVMVYTKKTKNRKRSSIIKHHPRNKHPKKRGKKEKRKKERTEEYRGPTWRAQTERPLNLPPILTAHRPKRAYQKRKKRRKKREKFHHGLPKADTLAPARLTMLPSELRCLLSLATSR